VSKRKKVIKENPDKDVKKSTSPITKSGFWQNSRLHLIIIGALAAVLYANTLGCDYTWDDAIVITENDFTKTAGLLWNIKSRTSPSLGIY